MNLASRRDQLDQKNISFVNMHSREPRREKRLIAAMDDILRSFYFKMLCIIAFLLACAGFTIAPTLSFDFSGLTTTTIISLLIFALVTSAAPGPNTIMLMSSGMNFGFKASAPHMLGVVVGVPILVALVGMGLHQLFALVPYSFQVLKILGMSYVLYLAWRIATTKALKTETKSTRPMSFIQSVLFQWVNPAVWTHAITAHSIFSSETNALSNIFIIASAFVVSGAISTNLWSLIGHQLKHVLNDAVSLHAVNILMAAVLVLTLLSMILILQPI